MYKIVKENKSYIKHYCIKFQIAYVFSFIIRIIIHTKEISFIPVITPKYFRYPGEFPEAYKKKHQFMSFFFFFYTYKTLYLHKRLLLQLVCSLLWRYILGIPFFCPEFHCTCKYNTLNFLPMVLIKYTFPEVISLIKKIR